MQQCRTAQKTSLPAGRNTTQSSCSLVDSNSECVFAADRWSTLEAKCKRKKIVRWWWSSPRPSCLQHQLYCGSPVLGEINSLLNLVQILRMIMSHMHQEDRKMFITQITGPSRVTSTRGETSGCGFYYDWGLGLGWESLWVCGVWTSPLMPEASLWGVREKRRGGVWRQSGIEHQKWSQTLH